MQNGIRHTNDTVRLSLPKQLKEHMSAMYGIHENFLYLKNSLFKDMDTIKQIVLYPPVKGVCSVIVVYEMPDVPVLPDNCRYLSIDLGIHNLMACYNSASSETFIGGRKYLSICRYYNKEISRVQSQWYSQQEKNGITHPKSSDHVCRLYKRKADAIKDYLHKLTQYIVGYCIREDIHTVVIGDITNIRKDKDLGKITNQKLHALPYKKIYTLLGYKLAMAGIRFVIQKESYSSQTSPLADTVGKDSACKSNRISRGLYRDGGHTWNADCVGAFNTLRLYFQTQKIAIKLNPMAICDPYVVKVAA